MKYNLTLNLTLVLFLISPCTSFAEAKSPNVSQEQKDKALVSLVEKVLDYKQGDLESLVDAKSDFTAVGWDQFTKWLTGWRDNLGAPTGNSDFTPSHPIKVVRSAEKPNFATISGTLHQSQDLLSSTYQVEVDVTEIQADGKIDKLKVRMLPVKKP